MKRVLTAVVLIPLVLLAVFRAPLWLFAVLVAAIIVLALHEYLHIAEAAGLKPFKSLTYAVGLLPTLGFLVALFIEWYTVGGRGYASYPMEIVGWWVICFLAPVIFGIPLVFRKDLGLGLASSATSTFGLFYIAASLSLLISLRSDPAYSILVLVILFSVWAGDIAAFYVGRSIGKHKLAPVVSPHKSWEGAIASVVASTVVALLVLHFTPQLSNLFVQNDRYRAFGDVSLVFSAPAWWHALIIGILTNVAAQFGDLFESALKRGASLKDSGGLLPGHGGVLDRIDALLFAIPVVWYYAHLTRFLQARFN